MLTSVKPPTLEDIRGLTIADTAIMAGLADSLRDTLKKYIQIDPFTMPDPFTDKDEYNYSIIVDKERPNRIVAMMVIKQDPLPQLPWDNILGTHLINIPLSKQNAK